VRQINGLIQGLRITSASPLTFPWPASAAILESKVTTRSAVMDSEGDQVCVGYLLVTQALVPSLAQGTQGQIVVPEMMIASRFGCGLQDAESRGHRGRIGGKCRV